MEFLTSGSITGDNEHIRSIVEILVNDFGFPPQMDFGENVKNLAEMANEQEKSIEGRTLQPGEELGDEDDLGNLFDSEDELVENTENEPPTNLDNGDTHEPYSLKASKSLLDQVLNQDPKVNQWKLKPKKRKRSDMTGCDAAKKSKKQPLVMKCNQCDKMVTKQGMIKHLIRHVDLPDEAKPYKVIDGYQCQRCSFVKKGEHHVREHTVKKHGYLNDHFFKSKGSLEDMFTFEGIQQKGHAPMLGGFFCGKCHKTFETPEYFQKHCKLPHIYKCDICDTRFVKKTLQKRHMDFAHIRKNDLKFCQYCDRSFLHTSLLNIHVKNVHDLKCDMCHKKFESKYAKKHHVMKEHHYCDTCDVKVTLPCSHT